LSNDDDLRDGNFYKLSNEWKSSLIKIGR